jgi:hypothetical protein
LKEQQAKLIMEQYEREDKEETHWQLQQEVDNLKRKHQLIIDENNLLSIKVNQHCHFIKGRFKGNNHGQAPEDQRSVAHFLD